MTSKQSLSLSENNLISKFLKQTITAVNGNRNQEDIEQFLTYEFKAGDSKKFRSYVIDNQPGINFDIEVEGEDGSTFTAGFRVGLDLFWF
jgi:hypothetical protein